MSNNPSNDPNNDNQNKKEWRTKGNKALIINIIFFVILFIGILLVPAIGWVAPAIIITLVFAGFLWYIYKF